MSRAARINKEKVLEGLQSCMLTQKELAEKLGINHQAFNHALSVGRISVTTLNQIGRALNLSPEYLSDRTDDSLDFAFSRKYAFHYAQDVYSHPYRAITDLLLRNGFDPRDYSMEQMIEMDQVVNDALNAYMAKNKPANSGGKEKPGLERP